MVTESLKKYREEENKALKNAEAEVKDPKVAHEKFVREMNNDLEAYKLKIYQAFASENDKNGDLKFQKEQTLEFYDELVRGSEAMVIPCLEIFSRYTLKYNASQDADVKKKRAEFCDSGVKARVELAKEELKKNKADALTDAIGKAKADKADSLNALEQAIKYAKMAEADAAAAETKLTELKAERDTKAAAAKDKEEVAAKAKAEKEAGKEKTPAQIEKEEKKTKDEDARKKELADTKEKEQAALAQAITDAKEDTDAMQKAIEEAGRHADTTEANNAMNELIEKKAQGDAVAQAEKDAQATATSNWRITVDKEIDAAIHEWTEQYEANSCTQQQAGFAKFFDGKNETGDDFELTKNDLYKNLAVGEGFEAFVQELGWKVTEAGALEAVKSRLDKAIKELEKAKAEAFKAMAGKSED